jgi:hypothetical protein
MAEVRRQRPDVKTYRLRISDFGMRIEKLEERRYPNLPPPGTTPPSAAYPVKYSFCPAP